jgi:hypothetical protein
MQRTGAFLLVLAMVCGTGLRSQTPAEPRTFLLFIDDLHLEFVSTPRVRDVMLRMVAQLTRPRDRWAIVTTGTSGVSVAPTPHRTVVESAIRRVTGGGLTYRSFLDSRQHAEGMRELRHRAGVALSTAVAAIRGVSAAQDRRPFDVLYISNGYDAGLIDPSGLMQAAAAANARVYTIDPRGWSSAADRAGVSQADWDGYLEATRSVLREVAARTQGMTVFTDADLSGAQSLLTAGGR